MANIKAYVEIEYIGVKRDLGEGKVFHNWRFDKANNWKCRVPSNIADLAIDFPDHFIIHDDAMESHPSKFSDSKLEERVSKLENEVKMLKARTAKKKK